MTSNRNFWRLLGSGFLIGLGLVVPGISGAALALALGLYEPIIAVLAKPFANWRSNLIFLFPLAVGMVVCLALFGQVLALSLGQHPLPTYYFLGGLVLGSLPLMLRGPGFAGFRLSYLVAFCLGLAVLAAATSSSGAAYLHLSGAGGMIRSILLGSLLGVGLLVPGLSASFLLMAFGLYEELVRHLVEFDFGAATPILASLGFTVMLISKGINRLYAVQPGYASYGVLGLLAASLWRAFPGWPRTISETALCLSLLVGGLGVSTLVNKRTH